MESIAVNPATVRYYWTLRRSGTIPAAAWFLACLLTR